MNRLNLFLIAILLGTCTPSMSFIHAQDTGGLKPPHGYVRIEAGTFMMGSPISEQGEEDEIEDGEVLHQVTITRPFWMKITEVTHGEWNTLMGVADYSFNPCDETCPLIDVSWFDALAYANALSVKEGLQPCYDLSTCAGTPWKDFHCTGEMHFELSCQGYRLPTEAEWEYAARAGTTTRFYSGDTISDLDRIAWHGEGADYCEDQICGNPHPVAQKKPNAWGLYDMIGNVREWVWDAFDDYPTTPQIDPQGPIVEAAGEDADRIYRGGSWEDVAKRCRAAHRNCDSPTRTTWSLGFRLVRTIPSP